MKYKETIKKINQFIRGRSKGLNGGVIGLSGGIDSTVVAYLSVRALGKEKVYGLILPYGKQSTEHGELIAKQLGIDYDIINIKPMVDAFEKQAKYFEEELPKGNLMARVRMCLLYGAANKMGRLVLGTTNKSEMEIGYFTKHGDGAVDIEPIVHLYKTEVWKLAEELKEPEVPKEIIEKKLKTSLDELTEMGAVSSIIIIFNKTDLLTEKQLLNRLEYLQKKEILGNKKTAHISIKNKENIDELLNIIYNSLPQLTKIKIKLPINKETQSLISWIYEKANITNISYNKLVTLSVECNPGIKGKIITRCRSLNGDVII